MFLSKVVILIFVSVATSDKIVFPCLTPTSENGYCISFFECTVLQKTLGNSNPSDVEYVKNSICRNWALRDLMVCCPTASFVSNNINPVLENSTNPVLESNTNTVLENKTHSTTNESDIIDKKAQREYALKKLLPTRKYCGLQHTDDRFYNDTETALDEFPWLVHVLFGDEGDDTPDPLEYADRCSGVLINTRYILTSGFCARNPLKARLGQYNTVKTISCVQNTDFPECTEPIVEIKIEKEIHRVEIENDYSYDFALFRLAERVTYTDFVRPICLPIRNAGEPENLQTLTFSGWGAEDQQGVVKKRLLYNLTDLDECFKLKGVSSTLPFDTNITCLKPPENNTFVACSGDEGGPLMYSNKHQWFVDSIVNQVYGDEDKICSKDKPIDANKITPQVIEWILETIQP